MQDPIVVRKALGQRVRALRAKRKWSQEDLAHESGLARSFTGAIERGEKDLRLSTLIKLASLPMIRWDAPSAFLRPRVGTLNMPMMRMAMSSRARRAKAIR